MGTKQEELGESFSISLCLDRAHVESFSSKLSVEQAPVDEKNEGGARQYSSSASSTIGRTRLAMVGQNTA